MIITYQAEIDVAETNLTVKEIADMGLSALTVFNGVADTTYTYHFPPDGMVD